MGRRLQIVPRAERECGECSACCTALEVAPLSKARGVACVHLSSIAGAGCGIYETRPDECRAFECLWKAGLLEVHERPDLTGVVVFRSSASIEEGRPIDALIALPADKALGLDGLQVIRRLVDLGGQAVIVDDGADRYLDAPPGHPAIAALGATPNLEV